MSKGKIIGKSIQEMIDEIRKARGSYEAKRLERAADEVPNLERLYQREVLEGLFSGDNAKGVMTMRPGEPDVYKQGGPVHKQDGGSIKASPAKPGQQFLGRLGQVAEKLGIKLEEAMKIVAQEGNSPVKAFLVNMLGSETLKSAGTALQDWTGTPRDATEDYPYRRLVTGKGMTAQFDPRLLDVAPIAGTAASRVAGAMKNLPTDVMRAATAAYGPQATASHIFIGAKSPLWKASQAEKAVELEKSGVSPVDIWKQTGTFRSPDGALRQEISDVGSKFRGEKEMKELAASMKQEEEKIKAAIAESKLHPDLFPKQLKEAQKQARQQAKDIKARRTMEDGPEYRVSRGNRAEFALEHPELYEAYPLLSGMDVQQGGSSGSALGSYIRGINESDPGMVNIYDRGLANDPRSTMIHEAQHAIQNIEGWGRGGNQATAFQNPEAFDILNKMRKQLLEPLTYEEYVKVFRLDSLPSDEAIGRYETYKKGLPDATKKMDAELQRQAAKLYYDRLAGEAEARAAQARIDLTPQQRLENFPLETGTMYGYDVKPEDIIVKRNKKGGQVSIDAMRLAVQNKANGGAATSNEAMLRREKRLGKVDKPVSIPPKQLARGWAAGTLGLPGDIESLGRAVIPGVSEETFLPTSEDLLKKIPGAATDEVGQRAAEIGTLFGGAGTALGGKLAAKGARAIAPKIGETAEEYMFRAGMAQSAVPREGIESAIKSGKAVDKKKEFTSMDRARAGFNAAELIKTQPQVLPSEALGQAMEKGFKKLSTTQSDRTRVGGGNIGGAPFPVLGEVDPAYAGKSWGVMDTGTASRLINLSSPETAWTTLLGSATQLKTNPIVFDKMKRAFLKSMKEGNLSKELESKINKNLEVTFGEGASIRDPKIWKEADSFEKRAALADIMMGQGLPPSKGGVAIGGEKSGKGVIFKPTEILVRETEPYLLHPEHGGDVPTFALGPRLFTIGKEQEYRPELHPAFPTLLSGKDLGFNVKPSPSEVLLPQYYSRFKELFPERKSPGYYDLALGLKGEGLPSQDLNNPYIRHLIREGFKKGGAVKKAEGGQITADDLIVEERPL
jgi:hypothetical protein